MKLIPLIALLTACGTSESGSLLTTGISAEIGAVTTGDGSTRVSAELFEGNPDQLIFVDLQAGDTLVADVNGQSMTLAKAQLLTIIDYEAVFATGDEGDEFTVDFRRTVDDGAPSSTATLPAAFTLDPLAQSYTRTSAIPVTYGPSGTADTMGWQASGDCIRVISGALPSDSGSFTIAANMLVATAGATSCTVTVSVTRDRRGSLDSNYGKGGSIIGEQVRTAMITSTP
ncbi:MAG: hypothetical protein ABI591_03565 [Kofleriaceae bacterium]